MGDGTRNGVRPKTQELIKRGHTRKYHCEPRGFQDQESPVLGPVLDPGNGTGGHVHARLRSALTWMVLDLFIDQVPRDFNSSSATRPMKQNRDRQSRFQGEVGIFRNPRRCIRSVSSRQPVGGQPESWSERAVRTLQVGTSKSAALLVSYITRYNK